ncbi:MAG: N-acetyl-gamma-glutamyl-phosphate reductase [Elusimicrobia bacterium]|nr:N-acetyl-gamma-glutamyl-phosphate reductase [Elusimicrobiota bacterium]
MKVSIIGATGYTGGELLHYLLKHPEATLAHCTSQSQVGKPLSLIHPNLAHKMELKNKKEWFMEKCDVKKIAKDSDIIFICLPHGEASKVVKEFYPKKIKIIDLSADFRLRSSSLYESWYKTKHPCPALLKQAVYGLPELYRKQIAKAVLVANPGCYATAAILSASPLVQNNWSDPNSLILDAKSGVSGAGKKLELKYLFTETNENFLAYAVNGHRHSPEIEQELSNLRKDQPKIKITFVPHLLPIHRGILVTLYANLTKKTSLNELWDLYRSFYKNEPFVKVLPQGSFPELKAVQHSNFCQIGVHLEEKTNRAIVIGTLDNLGKGASSQAIQNMNLMFGLEETCGLL